VDQGERLDGDLRALHPHRDITLSVVHAPDIDMVWAFDVENQVRIARQRPGTQARQIELMRCERLSETAVFWL
jgi:hypothetical protein